MKYNHEEIVSLIEQAKLYPVTLTCESKNEARNLTYAIRRLLTFQSALVTKISLENNCVVMTRKNPASYEIKIGEEM